MTKEQRIEKDAEFKYPNDLQFNWHLRVGYIAGATKEAQMNKEDAIAFSDWCADNFKKMASLWHPYNSYTTKCEDKNYDTKELYELYKTQNP